MTSPTLIQYSVTPTSLPDAEDLFADLEEAYDIVQDLRAQIETVFGDSSTRDILGGFVEPGRADLRIVWNGTRATVSINLKGAR